MLYHLLFALRDQASVLNVTRYITFRTAVASLTALFLVLLLVQHDTVCEVFPHPFLLVAKVWGILL